MNATTVLLVVLDALAVYASVVLTLLSEFLTIALAYHIFRRGQLWLYNGGLGERLRNFGTPPYKGYNRWRSRRWNLEHTSGV